MKKIISGLLILAALLASCSNAPTATVTPTPSPVPSPTPTETPLPPATAIPTLTEGPSRNALLGLGYTDAELKDYTISEGTYSFPGDTVTYNGFIGTKADGTKEIFAFKFSDNPNYLKLSSSEIREYAIKSRGSTAIGEGGFFDIIVGNESSTKIFVMSTGISESIPKLDDSGKVVAITHSILVVAQDDKGNPRLIRVVLQLEDGVKPGEDVLSNNWLWFFGGPNGSTKIHSSEELKNFVPKGTHFSISMQSKISPNENRLGAHFFHNIFDSDLSSPLGSFLLSHGNIQDRENPMLMLYDGISVVK